MAFKNTLLFDYLANILKHKSESLFQKHISDNDFDKFFSNFMILRYLSMHINPMVRNIVINNQVVLERTPSRLLYKYLINAIPKQQGTFIKYLK